KRQGCRAQRITCARNLGQVGLAFRQWALDQQDRFPMQVSTNQGGTLELVSCGQAWGHFQVMSNELNTPCVVFCPQEKNPARKRATCFSTTEITAASATAVPFNSDANV